MSFYTIDGLKLFEMHSDEEEKSKTEGQADV